MTPPAWSPAPLVTLTPVAALMFRFNNPDALLVFLMTLAAYFVVRARSRPSAARTALRWLLLAGVALGFAFLTKMLQGLIVLPAFALAYLVARPGRLWTRIWHLLAAGGALIVSAGWYVLLVVAVAGRLPPVHRRQHRQLPVAAGHRLQRPGPDLRRDSGTAAAGGGGGVGGAGGGGRR